MARFCLFSSEAGEKPSLTDGFWGMLLGFTHTHTHTISQSRFRPVFFFFLNIQCGLLIRISLYLAQWISNENHLESWLKHRFLIPSSRITNLIVFWGESQEFTFLTSSQVMPILLFQGQYLENYKATPTCPN